MSDPRIDIVRSRIGAYSDFPKAGITFRDLFGVYADKEAFAALSQLLKEKAKEFDGRVDVIVGLDARGFLMGPVMAEAIGVPFVPVSKYTLHLIISYFDLHHAQFFPYEGP